MRSLILLLLSGFVVICLPMGCVDSLEQTLSQRVNIVVVDGSISNLDEPQVVHLNRSKSDSLTGRFGTLPITGAIAEFIVDSLRIVPLTETEAGRYQASGDFKGQVGHAYQLRFTLKDGTQYQSLPEVMLPVPPIQKVYEQFNPNSLPEGQRVNGRYAAANDVFIDWQDPASEHNYYRWDYKLWEKKAWCRSCANGWYIVYDLDDKYLVEACTTPANQGYWINDYPCRTACWEILHNFDLNVFDDAYSNGGLIQRRRVAQIPYYQDNGCLVEIRQSTLTRKAYQYYKLAQDQTQNNGGVADTPPTALIGNVKNMANPQEPVVGYFTASAIAPTRYWLDRKENTGKSPGLFVALNLRKPSTEDGSLVDPESGFIKPTVVPIFSKRYTRPPTAVCVEGDNSTATKPLGWRD